MITSNVKKIFAIIFLTDVSFNFMVICIEMMKKLDLFMIICVMEHLEIL